MARALAGIKIGLGAALLLAAPAFVAANVPAAAAAEKAASAAKPAPADKKADTVPGTEAHTPKAPAIDIAHMRDPFQSYIDVLQQQNKARMAAFRNKRPDHPAGPLESFDLSSLKLVAIMQMGEKRAAMVQDPEGKGYVVRVGNYIGRDNGRVVGISATSVQILEDEFSPTGEVIKRKTALTLNDVNTRK